MLRTLLTLALILTATAARGAIVAVSSASVDRAAGTVEIPITVRPDGGGLLSNLSLHVAAFGPDGQSLALVGGHVMGGIFAGSPNTVWSMHSTTDGAIITQDFFGPPWSVTADGLVATAIFDVSAAPLGEYLVTAAHLEQISAVLTTGHGPDGGIMWTAVPLGAESGTIVVHTPEPATWLLMSICSVGALMMALSARRTWAAGGGTETPGRRGCGESGW